MSTTRAKYEQHSADPACRGCHQLIDPVGFGFEAFDPIGRYREMEGMHPIDARGELVGTDVDGPFSGPAELAERLMRSTKFRRCLVKNLHQFAAGRPPHRGDWPEVDVLVGDLARGEDRLPELVVALVRRPAFVQRRAWTDRRPPGAGGTPMPGLGGRQ